MSIKPNPSASEPYQLLPSLSANEWDALRDNIAEYGIENPILIDEHGEIIDGHHRWRISQELNIECPYVVIEGLTVDEKRDRALTLNMLRRNLSLTQKRKIAGDVLLADPSRSNNSIAKLVGMSDVTIGAIRRELGLDSDVRVGDDGKEYKVKSRPAEDQSDKVQSGYIVSVMFETETDQLMFIDEMLERGLQCRASIF